MHLPRHTITSHNPAPAFVRACFSTGDTARSIWKGKKPVKGGDDQSATNTSPTVPSPIFACANKSGFTVFRSFPLEELARTGELHVIEYDQIESLPNNAPAEISDNQSCSSGLSHAVPVDDSSLLLLVGGGHDPRFSPNKVILWDESIGHPAHKVGLREHNLSASLSRVGLNDPVQEPAVVDIPDGDLDDASNSKYMERSSADLFHSMADISAVTSNTRNVDHVEGASQISKDRTAGKSHGESSPAASSSPAKASAVDKVVAELEFGEAVTSVLAGTQRGEDGAIRRIILTCILKSKAAVLELTIDPPGHEDGAQVKQRAVLGLSGNQDGLGATRIVQGPHPRAVIALPGKQAGHAQVIVLSLGSTANSAAQQASTMIAAHTSPLSSLCLSPCGTLLATTSEKGTLIRVWSIFSDSVLGVQTQANRTKKGAVLIRELRRGLDTAKIHDVCFSPDSRYIAVASETGTIHFFSMEEDLSDDKRSHSQDGDALPSPLHRFKTISQVANLVPASMLPQYFKSEWSFAQYRIPLISFSARAESQRPQKEEWVKIGGKESTASGPSSEGQWAHLRERIEDVRHGDAGIDEKIVMDWVKIEGSDQLVILTTSGSYYRVSLNARTTAAGDTPVDDGEEAQDDAEDSVVLDMYKSASTSTKKKGAVNPAKPRSERGSAAKGCKLEEFRKFGMADEFAL